MKGNDGHSIGVCTLTVSDLLLLRDSHRAIRKIKSTSSEELWDESWYPLYFDKN